MDYVAFVLLSFVVSLVSTSIIRKVAIKNGHFDDPKTDDRKIHKLPTPRVGGVAIFISAIVALFLSDLEITSQLGSLMIAATGMFTLGIVDDIRGVRARTKLVVQIILAGVVLAGGTGIVEMNFPFFGIVRFDTWIIPVEILGHNFNLIPIANLISIAWIVAIVNAINLVDGLDGLAGGISLIGLVALAAIGLTTGGVGSVVLIALVLAGATLGFLAHNVNPAKIFLGDSGAYTLGLFLAVLPIYSGTKLAVGTVVISVAIIDMFWAIARRAVNRRPIFSPDRGHLHHQLVDSGLSQNVVVALHYIFALSIALAAIVGGVDLSLFVLGCSLTAVFLWITYSKRRSSRPT